MSKSRRFRNKVMRETYSPGMKKRWLKAKREAEKRGGRTVKSNPKPDKRAVEACKSAVGIGGVSRGEQLMKELLDFIFEDQFYMGNTWPGWLQGMELDRYYPVLDIAFEYQGFQHQYVSPDFHSSAKGLERQQSRDRRKVELCAKRGVAVIAVFPYHLAVGAIRNLIHASKQQEAIAAMVPASRRKARRRDLDNKCLDYKGMLASYKL